MKDNGQKPNPFAVFGKSLDSLDIFKRRIIIEVDLKSGAAQVTADKPIPLVTLADTLTQVASVFLKQLGGFLESQSVQVPAIGGDPQPPIAPGTLKGGS